MINNQLEGSSIVGEPEFLVVGKIRKPHGIRGEIRMEVLTDFPERLESGAIVYVGEKHQPEKIVSTRWHQNLLLIKFEKYQDRESVDKYRNQFVYVKTAERPELPEGEYYHHEILGLRVITIAGDDLGILDNILITGANDVYIVKDELGNEILLPAIESVIQEINLERGEMIVQVLPGLIP